MRRRVVAAVVGVLVVVALAVGVWWHTSPTAFNDFSQTRASGQGEPGQRWYFGVSWDEPGDPARTITLEDASARISENSAQAEIGFVLCRSRGTMVGAANDPIDEFCSEVVPLDDARMRVNAVPGEQVLVSVRPTTSGVVRLEGVDLRYRDGWQRGSQHVGQEVFVYAR